ncbi:hypothetical protein ACKKBG_A00230 [Auxenochlorella protothecoides x Auxenochlorella symbiontica]
MGRTRDHQPWRQHRRAPGRHGDHQSSRGGGMHNRFQHTNPFPLPSPPPPHPPPLHAASHTRLRGCALEVYYSHAPAICLTGGATLQRRCYRLAGGGDASPRFVLVTYAFSVSRRRPGAPAPTGPSSGQALTAAECSVLRTRLESVERELFQERETSAELRAQLALAWATTGVRGVMPRTKGVTCDGTAEADAVLVEMRGETSKRSRLEFLLAADADSCCESCLSGVVVAQSPGAEPSLPDWGLDGGARPGKNDPTAQEGAAPGVGPL